MTQSIRVFYESSNGDRWALSRPEEGGTPYVVHLANEPSGGAVTSEDVGAFLTRARSSPEQQALLDVIGTLLQGNDVAAEQG